MLNLKNIKIVEITDSHIKVLNKDYDHICDLRLTNKNKVKIDFKKAYSNKYLKDILQVKKYILREGNPDLYYNRSKLNILKELREYIKDIYIEFRFYYENYILVDNKIILAENKKILNDEELCKKFSLRQIKMFADIIYCSSIKATLNFEKIEKLQSNETTRMLKEIQSKKGYIELKKLAGNYKTKDYPFYYIFSEWIKKIIK